MGRSQCAKAEQRMDPVMVAGIANGAVGFLLGKLDALATREWYLQEKIGRAIQDLGLELQSIEAVLRDAASVQDPDHQFTVWIQNIRHQAYGIEDVLLLFTSLRQESLRHLLQRRHSIHNLIKGIEGSLQRIQQIRERYQYHSMPMTFTRIHSGNITDLPATVAPLLNHLDTVGIEEPTNQLISWALEPKQRLEVEVMFVVGMAGLGKTTLVQTAYEWVNQRFKRRVWIPASNSKTGLHILTLLLEEFGCPITHQPASLVSLTRKLRELLLLNRPYFIVLDDLRVKEVWESVRLALPQDGMNSRIIITTRRGDIANSCSRDDDSIAIHKLQPLSPDRAARLFHQKAFPRSSSCPPALEELSKSILQKCDGLPLGIIEIGRLLSNKPQTKNQWKIFHDSLESELRSGGRLLNIRIALSASYKDLPYHLKYCFLYMSIFPENNPVERRRLVRLWIAEGLVKEETGKTLEEVGEDYLKEMIDRNLIKTNELDFDGLPKRVRVHSLMLKMILSISHGENFCTVWTGATRNLDENTRRLSIQKEDFVSQDLPCVRSFFSISIGKVKIDYNFKLLRVLDIQSTPLEEFPSVITDLLLLRYLSLRNTHIRSIPKSVRNLHQLETLDLKQTLVTEVPKAVVQLEKLRHLLVYRYNTKSSPPFDIVQGFKAPRSISKLKNLQKLSFVKARVQSRMRRQLRMIQGLDNLTQLRKLGVVDLAEEDGESLCHSIGKMPNLHSLSVTSLGKEVPLELDAVTNPPALLQRLYLKGPLQKLPKWISSALHDLVRIRLQWSSLVENPLAALQNLPNLLELQLLHAYTGTQLEFKSGKFQQLKILDLQQLERLSSIVMEEGSLPCLQKLIIGNCSKLVHVPSDIGKLISTPNACA